jgi:hypothetical protein
MIDEFRQKTEERKANYSLKVVYRKCRFAQQFAWRLNEIYFHHTVYCVVFTSRRRTVATTADRRSL